ncbi:MAG: MFS transporter [Deltaproteobacteria bacterium]|nr:MFS transporter [Deltaproteobacteria bacterium]
MPQSSVNRPPIRHLRWLICGLLFLATLINYTDRITVSALKDVLQKDIGWDEAGYGWINFAFQLSYALMFPIAGRLLDRFGVRTTMIWAVIVWSIAAMGHSLAASAVGFAIARFVLGLGEAANFPAAIKAVAEWFPRRERAMATGLFNTGTNVGAMMIGPVAILASYWGWQATFVVLGAAGFIWLIAWVRVYRSPNEHPRLSAAELAIIQSDGDTVVPKRHLPWPSLLRYRQAWAFFLGKMLTDPVWWFYLYWLPPYLKTEHGLSPEKGALLIFWPYLAADAGSIFGGWLSSFFVRRGYNPGKGRLMAMVLFAFAMPFSIISVTTDSMIVALVCVSLATSCHQAWSANLFTTASDMFPAAAVGSVVGFGSMCGAIGGLIMVLVAGGMLQWLGSYTYLFIIAGIMHPTAWALIRVLGGPKLDRADVDDGLRTARSPALLGAGAIVVLLGLGLGGLIIIGWETILAATRGSVAAAASGIGAATLITVVGAGLMWASRDQAAAAVVRVPAGTQ